MTIILDRSLIEEAARLTAIPLEYRLGHREVTLHGDVATVGLFPDALAELAPQFGFTDEQVEYLGRHFDALRGITGPLTLYYWQYS